ncbi:alpha/beta hydrolase family protein [Kocuria sp. CPCC 205263]|uniref:alpha/beta hydrolase family protein n=1 Tax=Kocuria sp. CPCC 205263 TaxID=3073555 RepID=UPI0034D3C026
MGNPELVALPLGFERFHRRDFINYQLNRAHALGFADRQELFDAAAHLRSMDDCAPVFESLSSRAAAEGRYRQAAGHARIAEFSTPPRTVQKTDRYRRYLEVFDTAFTDAAIVRHKVPYAGAALPAYALPASGLPAGGTVRLHGGFDSLIEEFFPVCQRVAAAGFDVIAFEEPGQGGARTVHGLTADHDWEKPVAAVLDHFRLDRAGLVGISMGGYWALRAPGRESRIHSVVAWPPVYDWMHRLPPVLRAPVRTMVRHRGLHAVERAQPFPAVADPACGGRSGAVHARKRGPGRCRRVVPGHECRTLEQRADGPGRPAGVRRARRLPAAITDSSTSSSACGRP